MRKFVRQKSNGSAPDVELDFGAAAAKVARVFERLNTACASIMRKYLSATVTF